MESIDNLRSLLQRSRSVISSSSSIWKSYQSKNENPPEKCESYFYNGKRFTQNTLNCYDLSLFQGNFNLWIKKLDSCLHCSWSIFLSVYFILKLCL